MVLYFVLTSPGFENTFEQNFEFYGSFEDCKAPQQVRGFLVYIYNKHLKIINILQYYLFFYSCCFVFTFF